MILALVGRTPRSAAGPLAGFARHSWKADEGVGRGPGGPPHYSLADHGGTTPLVRA
jgi:hypothetical protein